MSSPTRSFKEDRKFVENFYTQTVDGCEELENVVEEQSIFWADDLDFANIMVVRTVSNMKASQTEVDLLPEYKNEDDREYAKELFRQYKRCTDRCCALWRAGSGLAQLAV